MELETESRCVAEGRLCDPLSWMVKVVALQPCGSEGKKWDEALKERPETVGERRRPNRF